MQINKNIAIMLIAMLFISNMAMLVNEVKGETKSRYTSHKPISINGNSEFTYENGVVSGNGTKENPYIIEWWSIYTDNEIGISIKNTNAYFVIRNCFLYDNLSDSKYGIYLKNSTNGKIENSEIKNWYGIYFDSYSDNNSITNNSIYNCRNGIVIGSSNNIQVKNNEVYDNYYHGVSFFNSNNNLIENNLIYNNSKFGVYLFGSCKNNQIINNEIYLNEYGIAIYYSSSDNQITKNSVHNNSCGIVVYSSSDSNQIIYNYIYDNSNIGTWIDSSNNNQVYLNNFINNTNQAYDDSNNYWDYNSSGNYWNDYKGKDENGDGIGDTPYLIDGGNNKDNFPLMELVDINQTPILPPIPPKKYISHEPIYINGNYNFTEENGVSGGDGTKENPYIIEGWNISGKENQSGILIENTDKYFVIRNVYVHRGNEWGWRSEEFGIYFYNVKNGRIENSEIENNRYGIYFKSSSYNQIIRNNVYYNNDGINLYYSDNNQIFGNIVYGQPQGVWIESSDNNQVMKNNVYDNGNGICLSEANNNQVMNNSVYDNRDGIILSYSDNNQIINNDANNCDGNGIILDGSKNNKIINNNIHNNKWNGITLCLSSNNQVSNNNIYDNLENGIYITDSSNNNIYLNNFINNPNQTYEYGNNNNNWDYNGKGNYWSDYEGKDENGDGIGDTPYLISGGNNKDNFPLMKKIENSVIRFPSKVILFYTEITENSIKLTWTKSDDMNFKNYEIYISKDSSSWDFLTSISEINENSFIVLNLNPNTTYYFKIRVYNSLGLFNDSNIISVKTSSGIQSPTKDKQEFSFLYIGFIIAIISIVIISLFLLTKRKSEVEYKFPQSIERHPLASYQQDNIPYSHPDFYEEYYAQRFIHTQCPNCKLIFQINTLQKEIQCPYCGTKGELK